MSEWVGGLIGFYHIFSYLKLFSNIRDPNLDISWND